MIDMKQLILLVILLFVAGCSNAADEKSTPVPKVSWDAEFVSQQCAPMDRSSLLYQGLAEMGLDEESFTFSQQDILESDYYRRSSLSDSLKLSWFDGLWLNPAGAGCFEGNHAKALDYYLKEPHPVSGIIYHSAFALGVNTRENAPYTKANAGSFDEALQALCASVECGQAQGEIPQELKDELAPVLRAIIEGIEARKIMDAETSGEHDPQWWFEHGGDVANDLSKERPDLLRYADKKYLLGRGGRSSLYKASAKISFALEGVEWGKFLGLMGVEYILETGAGRILIRDGSDHKYPDERRAYLLFIDLGGDDEYLMPIGANSSVKNPVSIAVDLAGADVYHYRARRNIYDREGLVPADEYGRYDGSEWYGNVTLSKECRQGAARNGIAMLFDLGSGDDFYQSLKCSQGYAHLGVGVLFDDGGSDEFVSEAESQGSAQFGVGLHISAGQGNDKMSSFTTSQGFGMSGGVGILLDESGDDSYVCDNGDEENGGTSLYYSHQLLNRSNTSLCQGAGYGYRGDWDGPTEVKNFSPGGFGILRDSRGNDTYEGGVFAQGVGYWQGVGILSDGEGSDEYDAFWYIQGAAAHYAVGILADSGVGDDKFNSRLKPHNVALGSGPDYSLGIFINENGNDEYVIPSLGAGASNCNGIGVFVDERGDDLYKAQSDYGSGMGNVSSECIEARPTAKNVGIMIDAGGTDVYEYPESSFLLPENNGKWGHARNGLESEYGFGIDAEGESGMR